jgi:hypothetical protein
MHIRSTLTEGLGPDTALAIPKKISTDGLHRLHERDCGARLGQLLSCRAPAAQLRSGITTISSHR